ncbi:MAG: hypothetical protein ACYTGZ_22600 [Planctomycetota bacterium]|jgi:hypothetical protein
MRPLIWLALIGISFGFGYYIRSAQDEKNTARQTRTDSKTDVVAERKRVLATLSEEEREEFLKTTYPELVRLREIFAEQERRAKQAADLAAATEKKRAEAEAADAMNRFRTAMQSQLPAWRATMSVNARAAGMQIARALGLDDETAKKFAAAFEREGARSAEEMIEMFTGNFEGDPEEAMDGFYWFMGSAGNMSESLAKDLGKLISDEDIGAAREEMRVRNKEQVDRQVEMQVRMMNLPDLNETQEAEIKEIFGGGGMMKEQSRAWGEIMKNPLKLLDADTDEKWAQILEPANVANRERMRKVLTDKQFEAYRRYEKQMIAQSRMWMEPMFAGARKKK